MADDQHGDSDDEQSEEFGEGEVTDGDADDTAHDTQMRYSPSFLPEHSSLCRNGREAMEGKQLRSAQRNTTQATRQASEQERKSSGSQALETSCTEAASSVGSIQEEREGCCP